MIRRNIIAVGLIIAVLCAIITWQFAGNVSTSVSISFVDDQTAIFSDMVEKAAESLGQSPPDVDAAIDCLKYTHQYYPSGSKQESGSRLDRIVERSRKCAELYIIKMLQETTDKNFGNDAEAWIREFGD